MQELKNQVLCGDSVEILRAAKEPFADLVFADPPFNIGYKYDQYHDRKKHKKYLAWTRDWIGECVRVLKPHGSIYIAIGDEYAAHIKLILEDELGLTLRNWVIWHYTFGQQTKNKFARAHTHILYFVKDAKSFVFNDETVRVISDRQKKYADRRANPAGKMPDDVWNEYPRVCGTFTERTGFPCQMPESLLARIIRTSSNEGRLGARSLLRLRHHRRRRPQAQPHVYDDRPLRTRMPRRRASESRSAEGLPLDGNGSPDWPEHADAELKWLYSENKIPVRHLCASRSLLSLFTKKLNGRLQKRRPYTIKEVSDRLNLLGSKLSPLDKVSAVRMEASSLEE